MSRIVTARAAPVQFANIKPQSSFSRFLEKRSFLLAICMIAIGTTRIVATYSELSITVDEPGHFCLWFATAW